MTDNEYAMYICSYKIKTVSLQKHLFFSHSMNILECIGNQLKYYGALKLSSVVRNTLLF